MEFYENHRDGMTRACAWYASDDRCLPHFHNSVELSLVLEGALSAVLDGHEYEVRTGEMLICSSFTIHAYATKNSSRSLVAIIPLSPFPALQVQLHKRQFAQTVLSAQDLPLELPQLLHMLAGTGTAAAPASDSVPNGLGQAALGLLIGCAGLTDAQRASRAQWLREVLHFLENNYASDLSVQSIAARFGYSKSRFSHLFNEQLGTTLPAYLNALRCQRAALLMSERPQASLLDIAMRVGFDCPRTFTRAFQRTFGVVPSAYER